MDNVIYFDSECAFCNSYVKFIIYLDKKDIFRFSSNKSSDIKNFRIDNNIDSIILVSDEKYYLYSDAIIKILELLGFKSTFLYIIPKFIRDNLYKIFAKYRKYFQNNNKCNLPNPSIKYKFLDDFK